MIVFELICTDKHRFEGWFASSEDFESQKTQGLLSCPVCGESGVEKLLTAKIRNQEVIAAEETFSPPRTVQVKPRNLNELIDVILLNTENVGGEFAAEARRIHRKEKPQRNIRGVASREETESLLEEGVPIMPLPIPPKSDWH